MSIEKYAKVVMLGLEKTLTTEELLEFPYEALKAHVLEHVITNKYGELYKNIMLQVWKARVTEALRSKKAN